MNQSQRLRFANYIGANKILLRNRLKTGTGRPVYHKEDNYNEVIYLLQQQVPQFNTTERDVAEAVAIIEDVLIHGLEVQRPPADNGAERKLAALEADASIIFAQIGGVMVQLDCDQLKHQHPTVPIGTRVKGGGNRFVVTCDEAWHRGNTMVHMAQWATKLGVMAVGEQTYHGQAVPVNEIHYEGFCLFARGQKYVSFHCYPANDSRLKWDGK